MINFSDPDTKSFGALDDAISRFQKKEIVVDIQVPNFVILIYEPLFRSILEKMKCVSVQLQVYRKVIRLEPEVEFDLEGAYLLFFLFPHFNLKFFF